MDKRKTPEKILSQIQSLPYTTSVEAFLSTTNGSYQLKQLTGSLGPISIAALWHSRQMPLIIIVPDRKEAENWSDDLSVFVEQKDIALLVSPHKSVSFRAEEIDQEMLWLMNGLSMISGKKNALIIATPEIFNYKLLNAGEINKNTIRIESGQKFNYDQFIRGLALNGFDRKDYVSMQGDMAVRGGIVDLFPVGFDNPVRIEFWGDDIESIREFNSISQRSITKHDSIEFIGGIFDSESEGLTASITDYLPDNTVIVHFNHDLILSNFEDYKAPTGYKQLNINGIGEASLQIKSVPQPKFDGSVNKLARRILENYHVGGITVLSTEGKIHYDRFREMVEGQLETILTDPGQEMDESGPMPDSIDPIMKSTLWLDNSLSSGFDWPEGGISAYTEHELFGRRRMTRVRKGKKSTGITLQELKALKWGDFVVHSDKGVGRFEGFKTITMGGSQQDCVKLTFDGGDILYVHLNYIHKIEKYSSQEGVQPKLSKLGSTEWARKKARAKKKLKDIARDLIKLYAERKMQPGFAFPADNIWQKEMEASFLYEDTPDQAQTTIDVKKDMERPEPMDRLVCGDVGFGKTEIAVRAAFKAVQSGKQVSILVPTTILAQQHYMTFRDRLHRFPVKVEAISRFRTKKEQTEILKGTESGRVDILIGTHRLLSKDIQFKDLGLLIIDEEHRFGVSAKEKLRKLRANIDTVTLTATPIPRTLNFSLMGARDLSVIETPPRNRLPVTTEILEWNDDKIRQAIIDELSRGGQVYYVSDRVYDLEKLMMDLKMLVPSARFGIAHGQMKGAELEKIMEKFIRKQYDILVSTKIIESGLDIPNANTIIINRSNHFGLAELYQLRGRVGRSNTQAFCYLIVPPIRTLPVNTVKRLQAIEEFTELGSGFQLAMRDMEIRGAGNLLGAEQSGFINDIGFDLFHKILDEAVRELRAEEFSELFADSEDERRLDFLKNEDMAIDMHFDAYIPGAYIESETDRYRYYKDLYRVSDNTELHLLTEEILDKYGVFPPEVEGLIFGVRLRVAALNTGFTKLVLRKDSLTVECPERTNKDYFEQAFPAIVDYLQEEMENAKMYQSGKKLMISFPISKNDEAINILWRIKKNIEYILD